MHETHLLRQTKVSTPHPRKNLLDPHRKTFFTQGDKIAYNLFILQGRFKQANVSNTMYQGGHASTLPCSLRRQKQHGATQHRGPHDTPRNLCGGQHLVSPPQPGRVGPGPHAVQTREVFQRQSRQARFFCIFAVFCRAKVS